MSKDIVYSIKKRWLPVYIILLVATIVLMLGLGYLYLKSGSTDYLSSILLVALFAAYIAWSISKVIKIKIAPKKLVSLIKCTHCDHSEERNYEKGDYVFKDLGRCPKCSKGRLYISGIYLKGEEEKIKEKIQPLPLLRIFSSIKHL